METITSTTTTTTGRKATPITDAKGRRIYADDGAVHQQGPRPTLRCSCGCMVVWLEAKSGRYYLAPVYPYAGNPDALATRYYYVGKPHQCEPNQHHHPEV